MSGNFRVLRRMNWKEWLIICREIEELCRLRRVEVLVSSYIKYSEINDEFWINYTVRILLYIYICPYLKYLCLLHIHDFIVVVILFQLHRKNPKDGKRECKHVKITGDCHMRVIEKTRQSFHCMFNNFDWEPLYECSVCYDE